MPDSTSGFPLPSSAAGPGNAPEHLTEYSISNMKAILQASSAPVALYTDRSDLEKLFHKYHPSMAKRLPICSASSCRGRDDILTAICSGFSLGRAPKRLLAILGQWGQLYFLEIRPLY